MSPLALGLGLLSLLALDPAAQTREPGGALPPLSWTCPMHPEVVDNEPGACPICNMALVRVRLDLVWTCPVHPNIAMKATGTCPACRRDLVRVIKAMSWTCDGHPTIDQVAPGACPICRRRLRVKYSDRPHGDHNPKHGGYFFMAPNNWHIELTHPAPGAFRMYAYDEYSKPFFPKGFAGRLFITSSGHVKPSDPGIPFARIGSRPYLEASVPAFALPARVVVKMRFEMDDPEYRFDFHFFEYSKEPK